MKKAFYVWGLMSASLFTVLTLISSILNLSLGQTHDSHAHILMRAGFVMIGVTTTVVYLYWPLKNNVLRYVVPYVVSVGLVFLLMFLIGFATTLHPDAYRDGFLNFTFVAIPIMISLFIYDRVKARKQQSDA